MPSKKRSDTRASRRKPGVVFFLDRCIDSKTLVTALATAGAVVTRHSDRFASDAPDEEWLRVAGAESWVVLTNDKRIRYRQNERGALAAAGVKAFVLTSGNLSSQDAADAWVRRLDEIRRVAESRPGPFIAHVTLNEVRVMA
jgi:predicted nuclease of predicted toxin-antitoxin system